MEGPFLDKISGSKPYTPPGNPKAKSKMFFFVKKQEGQLPLIFSLNLFAVFLRVKPEMLRKTWYHFVYPNIFG